MTVHQWTFRFSVLVLILVACTVSLVSAQSQPAPLNFPIVFVSSPRPGGDDFRSKGPDVDGPMNYEPSSHIMLLRPGQAVPEMLVDAGATGVATQPFVSYDTTYLLYSFCPDMSAAGVNASRDRLPYKGCNIMKMDLATRQITEIVGQSVWHPSESMGPWSKRPDIADPPGTVYLGYGVIHASPVELWNGDIFFTSSLNSFDIIKGYARPSQQGYIWHKDTNTVEQVWYPPTMVLDAAPLSQTGEISFATLENSLPGAKPHRWAIWSMKPFGGDWRPLFSATMEGPHTRHFHTEYNGNLVSSSYYLTNNQALGTIIQRPLFLTNMPAPPEFGSPTARKNTPVQMGPTQKIYWAYKPAGTDTLTPWAHTFDRASDVINGKHVGKVGFPWASEAGILISYSPGPSNYAKRPVSVPAPQLGIYLIRDGAQTDSPADLQLVYDDPARNEFFARPVATYESLYKMKTPKPQPTRAPNDGTLHSALPPGTPFALVGTGSVWNRESCGGQWSPSWECAKPVYSISDDTHSNRAYQGVDTHKFQNTDIAALRVIVQGGVSHLTYGPGAGGRAYTNTFSAHAGNERLHVLGDIPLYKQDAQGNTLKDLDGNPDTSVLARLPANVSFGFQLVSSTGMALTQPGTWHQLAPGVVDTRCNGCHVHFGSAKEFSTTAAGKPGFVPHDLTQQQPWTKEWYRDILPIVAAKCVSCHNPTQHAGNVDLETATMTYGIPRNYYVLAKDPLGQMSGTKPISTYVGRASRYIAPMAAAESLLAWVVAGKRLDGVDNATRPTDDPPGDASTLPPGLHRSLVDIDLSPSVVQAHANLGMTTEDVHSIITFIDAGAPIDIDAKRGWLSDEWKPVLTYHDSGSAVTIGVHDVGSGIKAGSFQVSRDGTPLQATSLGDGRFSVPRQAGRYTMTVQDHSGNSQTLVRLVGAGVGTPPLPPTVDAGEAAYTAYATSRKWIDMGGKAMPLWANLSDQKKAMWEKVQ